MTTPEKQALTLVLDRLEKAREKAPSHTTYKNGRTDRSLESEILQTITDIKRLLSEPTTASK